MLILVIMQQYVSYKHLMLNYIYFFHFLEHYYSPVTPVERLGIWKDIWRKKRQHDVPMSIKWKKPEYSNQSGILLHCPTLTSVCAILLIGIARIGMYVYYLWY